MHILGAAEIGLMPILNCSYEVNMMIKDNYDKIIELNFPKLKYTYGKQIEEVSTFKEKLYTKGIFLHKQVYEAIISYSDKSSVNYIEIANFIRYDKSTRDNLYKFLSAAEEYLRSELYNAFDVQNKQDPLTFKVKAKELTTKEAFSESNLYYASFSKNFSFGSLIDIIIDKKINCGNVDDLEAIRQLRNKVMHHTLLLLSYHTDKPSIDQEIQSIEEGIMALYRVLPTDGLKYGLTKGININNFKGGDINSMPNATELRLRWFKDGIFI